MKALSIKQPHIDNIITQIKKYEIRSWATKHRGRVLLCSAKKPASKINNNLILGHALAIAELVDIVKFTHKLTKDAMCGYKPDHYAWVFKNIKKITPTPIKGQLGLFNVSYGRSNNG